MASATELMHQALQAVKELEDQVTGSSPLAARLAKDKADLEEYAQKVLATETANTERAKALDAREAELNTKAEALDTLKKQLKELQTELTKAKKAA